MLYFPLGFIAVILFGVRSYIAEAELLLYLKKKKKAQECEIHEGIQPRAGPVQIIFGPKSLSTIISQLHLRQSLPFWVEADGGARCVPEGAFPAHCGPSLHVAFASHGAGQNRAGSGVTSSTSERAGLVLKSITIFRAGVGAIGAKSL